MFAAVLRTPATNFSYWTASCINFSQKAVDSTPRPSFTRELT